MGSGSGEPIALLESFGEGSAASVMVLCSRADGGVGESGRFRAEEKEEPSGESLVGEIERARSVWCYSDRLCITMDLRKSSPARRA